MNKKNSFRLARHLAGAVCALAVAAQSAVLLDFNTPGRPETEGNEAGYTPWPVDEGASGSITVSGIKFTVARNGGAGTGIKSSYYKAGVQGPNYARLVCDALFVVDGDAGASIRVTISGLSAGSHSLLAYHNGIDGNAHGDIKVVVNGTTQIAKVTQSNRELVASKVPTSYVTFTTTAGGSVTIDYTSIGSGSYKNVFIDALVLDLADPAKQASDPSPIHHDLHVDGDDGSVALSWKAASGASRHDVYFGTDSVAVAKAGSSSVEYKTTQTTTSWEAKSLKKFQIYWWRIDETDGSGTVTQGQVWQFAPRMDAFRGAEGYGRYARGGRGGKVVHVTNLNDAGAGSLREAIENDIGPRTIVFDVGGTIKLSDRLVISTSNVTVAGQTAPGKGIQVTKAPFGMSGAVDGVIRFMRVRIGYGVTYDGMGMTGADHSINDHNTINFAIDEQFSSRGAKMITLQRTFIAEALNVADHDKKPAGTAHGYAGSIGGDIGSFHHNLLAHNSGRNWSLACGLDGNGYYWGRLDIFNNFVYNWDDRTTDGGCHELNFVNNYYKPGAATGIFTSCNPTWDGFPGTQIVYCHGNIVVGKYSDTATNNNGCKADANNPQQWSDKPFFESQARIQTALDASKDVLSDVGANMPVFDDHDKRVLLEAREGTYKYKGSVSGIAGLPDREADVGGIENYPNSSRPSDFDTDKDGMPDWFESAVSGSASLANANADPDGDGYTLLDDYLEWMATPHAEMAVKGSATFNLSDLFRGYTKSPSYTVGTSSCVEGKISGTTLTVTDLGKAGCSFARLPVTVKDSEKSTMTRDILLYATGTTTGVFKHAMVNRSLSWNFDGGRVGVTTDSYGTLTIRDVTGKIVAQASGTGEVGIARSALPSRLLIASFVGNGFDEHHVVPAVR